MRLEQILSKPLKHAKITVFIFLLLVAVCAMPLKHLRMNNNLEVWFSKDNPAYSDYLKRNELFGTDYNLVIAYKNSDLFTIQGITENIQLLQFLNNLPSVKRATGLASLPVIFSNGIVLPPLNETKTFTEEHLLKIKQNVMTNKLYLHQVISEDGQKTAIVVQPINEDINTYRELAAQVDELLNSKDFSSLNNHLSGALYILIEFDKTSTQESVAFMILCMVVIFLLCILYFKRIRIAIIPFIIFFATMIVTYSVFTKTNNALSMVSSIMPIIIMIIVTALNMHILQHLQSSGDRSLHGLTKALVGVIKPCFLASITTAVALFAFCSSSIGVLRVLGIFTALGIIIAFIFSSLLSPALYVLLSKNVPINFGWAWHQSNLLKHIFNHKSKIIFLSLIFIIFSILGLLQLTPETDQIRQFKKSHQIRVTADTLQAWFKGIQPVDYIISSTNNEALQINQLNTFLEEFEDKILSSNKVEKLISPLTINRLANDLTTAFTPWMRDVIFSMASAENKNNIYSIFADSMRYARMHIWSQWMTNQEMISLADSLMEWGKFADIKNRYKLSVTGSSFIYTELNRIVFENQVTSVLFCFVIIFIIFIIFTRSLVYAIMAMIPNIFPVCFTLGLMGWFSIPLDVVTVVIAAVTLGISVDDTIHFMHGCGRNYTFNSMKRSIEINGSAIISTSLFISVGFIILVLSRFIPLIYFGLFVSLNALFALIFDLTLLPILLNYQYYRQRGK